MSENSYFKFFATNYLREIGRIYVLITAESKPNAESLYSEYFIFIESEKKMLGMQFHSKPFQFMDLKIDLSFMEKQATTAAEGAIDNYVYEKYKDTSPNIYLNQNYSLKEWNWIPLIKILKNQTFYTQIPQLQQATKCITLKDFIKKVWELEDFNFRSEELFK